jgi:hypothetical protein
MGKVVEIRDFSIDPHRSFHGMIFPRRHCQCLMDVLHFFPMILMDDHFRFFSIEAMTYFRHQIFFAAIYV